MTITYPQGLPVGLYSGRSYQLVSPLQRSELRSGRARQRRRFTSVPETVTISWLFNDAQGLAFESWWRDVLIDGSVWFEMPLDHPMGYDLYECRFTDVYEGPVRVGPSLWSYSASLETRERMVLDNGWGEFPEFILGAGIIDFAINQKWPQEPYSLYGNIFDYAINREWPL